MSAVHHVSAWPSDLEGGVGHRRRKDNPKEVEAVFGSKVHVGVAFEGTLGMEFPVALLATPGHVYDGPSFAALLEQMEQSQGRVKTVFHIADAHDDALRNSIAARKRGAKPIFHDNQRHEKTDADSLRERGYHAVGWPYAPWGVVMQPQGYDEAGQQLTFTWGTQGPEGCADGPFRAHRAGYVQQVAVRDNSRLVLAIPRGTRRYKIRFALRSSVERNNDYFADNGLARPKYPGQHNRQLHAYLSGTATLLRQLYARIEDASQQDAQPERYATLDLWELPLEQAICERWKHFHEEDKLQAFPDS